MTRSGYYFQTIAEMAAFWGLPAPEHPMVGVFRMAGLQDNRRLFQETEATTTSGDFYTISIKRILSGEMHYGRTRYDFSNGSLVFTAPRQEVTCTNVIVSEDAILIAIHEDFFLGSDLRDSIRRYGFFSYAVNEALHLSPREEEMIRSLMGAVHDEYRTNQDEFSRDLILSHIGTLLKYADRYYKRQFLNRAVAPRGIARRFEDALRAYLTSDLIETMGPPRIDALAAELGVSGRYLSDALRAETGKSAQDHIHLHLLEEAKNLLLRPDLSVTEVSYRLGFEYPQYFSRLFRKKVGVSPRQYRDQYSA